MGAIVAATAMCLAGAVSAGAATVTFGTNLEQPPNAPLACGQGVLNQFLLTFFPPFNGNCMWSSVVVGSAAESLTAPASGTVTAVRVRAGASTGPMQVNVVRFLFRQTGDPAKPELACCFLEAYGPVFTPAPNAITTVATNLPVTVEATPPPNDTATIAATDQLALSSLAPNVQVPLLATKNGENDLSVLSYAWYPAPSAPGVPAPSPNPLGGFWDMSGFKVLMNADLNTGGAPAGAPPPAPAPAPVPVTPTLVPAFALPKLTIPVRGGTATVPIQCLVLDCSGLVALQSAQRAGLASAAAKRAPKLVSYGTARFSLKAGTTGKVKVKLNPAGRKLLRSHRRAKVWANVRFSSGSGIGKSARVTLKR